MCGRHKAIPWVLSCFLLASQVQPLWAEEHEDKDRIKRLEERLARLESNLERLIDVLVAQPEGESSEEARTQLRSLSEDVRAVRAEVPSEAADAPKEVTKAALEPPTVVPLPDNPADEIINVPYSGYMEMHINHDQINPTTLDFHRFVLLFGHGFGERIRFWSELELEHAFVEGGEASGELELEQAYLDFLIDPKFNFRAGMVLTPIGIINERHEPPAFHGVERPFVDTVIIPSTWFGTGAGLVGDLGNGLHYRTYVMGSLDSSFFSAEEGFRDGRQKGFLENGRNLAWTGRLEYRPRSGLNLGTSFWTGETGFSFRDLNGRLKMFEFDGRYRVGRFEGRGQFVTTHLGDAAEINQAIRRQVGINPNIAAEMRGFYLEGASSLVPSTFPHDLVAFYRYESFDTQYRMPQGFFSLEQFDRAAHVLGLTYFPHPDIALKFDYNVMRNASDLVESLNRWNWGIGWWF